METGCGSICPVDGGFYAYDPSVSGNAALLAVSATLGIVTIVQGFRLRTLTLSAALATGLLLLTVGLVGRLLLSGSPKSQGYLVMSMLGTGLGSLCVSASILLLLPHILSVYGIDISPLAPLAINAILCGAAGVAAIVQIVGIVCLAYYPDDASRTVGSDVIAAGLAVQLLALLGFSGVQAWFVVGLGTGGSSADPTHPALHRTAEFKRFLLATDSAAALLLAYCVYRLVEMANGVRGELFQSQVGLMIVHGALPVLSALLVTVCHPGAIFGPAWGPESPLAAQKYRDIPERIAMSPLPSYAAHGRYDPEIRKQLSPASKRYRRDSAPPTVQTLSPEPSPGVRPGLPANPKPAHKSLEVVPSPSGAGLGPASTGERSSFRPGRFSAAPKQMVEEDSLW